MARQLTDGEMEILDELDRDAEPGPCPTCGDDAAAIDCPDCRPIDLGDLEFMRPPDPAEPTEAEAEPGPDPIDAAWWQGHTAARAEFEAERIDLEMTVARLEAMIADYRAELTHLYHD